VRSEISLKSPIKKNGDSPKEVLTEEDMRLREKKRISNWPYNTPTGKSTEQEVQPNSSASNPPPSSPASKK